MQKEKIEKLRQEQDKILHQIVGELQHTPTIQRRHHAPRTPCWYQRLFPQYIITSRRDVIWVMSALLLFGGGMQYNELRVERLQAQIQQLTSQQQTKPNRSTRPAGLDLYEALPPLHDKETREWTKITFPGTLICDGSQAVCQDTIIFDKPVNL